MEEGTDVAMAQDEVDKLCMEVLQTEVNYVEDLRAVLNVYVRPARKLDILSKDELSQMFSNLEEILICAEGLLAKLKAGGPSLAVETLADAFVAVAPVRTSVFEPSTTSYTDGRPSGP